MSKPNIKSQFRKLTLSTVTMIAGLHYVLYLLSELCRRVLPGRFTDRAIANGRSPGRPEETDRLQDNSPGRAGKMKSVRAMPSMVNVSGAGQSIAVLTSGGDAQGLPNIAKLIRGCFVVGCSCRPARI